jgi:cyclophilin family peptidyl-prolyl cis-trans isomerase
MKVIQAPKADPFVRLEAVAAIGGTADTRTLEMLVDLLTDPNPLVRGAALNSIVQLDRDGFMLILSALDPDPHWSARAALASALAMLPAENALPRLRGMLKDMDQRVIPAVLSSIVKLRAPEAADVLLERLRNDDPGVRAAAAAGLAELKAPSAVEPLAEAYRRGLRDPDYSARGAALNALAQYGAQSAGPVLNEALADKDWAIRVRAAALLKQFDPTSDADLRIRPAPSSVTSDVSQADRLANPEVSPQIYIDTDRGTIQIELAVLDAPLTAENFLTLARKGFYDGLTVHRVVPNFVIQGGDPRGDGEGGPGYTIRDELNQRPYLRGTVGMALDWNDTNGSQFFITHSPQPHLDARYTAFGRVVDGMDVVDQIEQGDVIRRVRANP